jgi:DNA-binding MarR family transcriptional regulator
MIGVPVERPSYALRGTLIAEVVHELRIHRRTIDLLENMAAQQLGVNATDAHCLEILERTGRSSAGELARALGLTTSAVTAVLDRLVDAGFVVRQRDSQDRRRVYVELTEAGRQHTAGIWDPLEGPLYNLVDAYSGMELTLIRDFLRRSREIVAERVEHLGGAGTPSDDAAASVEQATDRPEPDRDEGWR